MNKTKTLTKQQHTILTLIYRFRFVSTKHVQQALKIKYLANVQPRMNLLVEDQYIGRNYSSSQRLAGRPASYYLLPKGMKALKEFDPDVSRQVLHNIYKDKSAQGSFIQRCLAVGDINLELEQQYGARVEFFTQSEILEQPSDYFPQPLPYAYFTIADPVRSDDEPRHYFLEICESGKPSFVLRKRIQEYITYAEEGEWENATSSELPAILLVCETLSTHSKLAKLLAKEIEDAYEDQLVIEVITQKQLSQILSIDEARQP